MNFNSKFSKLRLIGSLKRTRLMNFQPASPKLPATNYHSGHNAEQIAAEYLEDRKFKIHKLNWKTKYCEIDIVAKKGGRIYFVEVKSRKNSQQGSGLDYITPKKLKQMAFAAKFWVNQNKWTEPYQLSVISIDAGEITFIENL